MSRTRIVGGKYTIKVGGDYNMYSASDIITTAGKEIIETSDEGIFWGDNPKLPPPIKSDAKCIVYARPKATWKGEFAFDWFREGNSLLLDDVDFNEIVGKYYSKPEKELVKIIEKENISSLSDNFIKDPNQWYIVDKDSDNNITGAKEYFKKDPQFLSADNSLDKLKEIYQGFRYTPKGSEEEKIYYSSIIGLFPENEDYGPNQAELNLHIEFLTDEKPDYLIFRVDGIEITEQHPIIGLSRYKIENPTELEALTIRCKARGGKNGVIELFYNRTKDIQIYSVKKSENDKFPEHLAGVIKFVNPTAAQKKKILIIKVQTAANEIGEPKTNSLSIFEKVLNQCLLQPDFITHDKDGKEFKLDISQEKHQFREKCKATQKDGVTTIFSTGYLGKMMVDELQSQFPNYMGSEYFRLYFLDVLYKDKSSMIRGYSNPNDNFGIMFKNHDPETIAHECLHGLGLPHTFSYDIKKYGKDTFAYKAQTTQNIMDYSAMKNNPIEVYNGKTNTHTPKEEYYLWYWQWKKVNRNIQ